MMPRYQPINRGRGSLTVLIAAGVVVAVLVLLGTASRNGASLNPFKVQ